MSYYESNTPVWPNTRPGWDRSGATNFQQRPPHASNPADITIRYAAQMKGEEPAFGSQLDEVDRAVDNLVKSGKMFPPQRRESMPVIAPRAFPVEHGKKVEPRMVPVQQQIPARHFAVQDYENNMRNQPAPSLQKFYAAQRFQPRPSEAEQMMQAQRRLAAQRERELRNYHQEQQFNRSMSPRSPPQGQQNGAYQSSLAILAEMSTYGKDRVMSPGSMTEDERRDLIARQRAALYGGEGGNHHDDGISIDENGTPRQLNNGPGSVSGSTRGTSPLSFDPFGLPNQNGNDQGSIQGSGDHHQTSTTGNSPSRSRTNSASSPSSKSANFNLFEGSNQQGQNNNRTSASSPGGSPPRGQSSRGPNGSMAPGVAPIGTRPSSQSQATNPALSNKRSTTPLPSPLSYGFSNEDPFNGIPKERSASAASNASGANGQDPANMSSNWGKVWGPNKGLGSVTSVWAIS
ncbi:hypothetical protein DFH27DRAFT_612380 [Peziza echinospora]|nr:hypothetical protein DFH27DRAFT_612380 [Peziza echinospora]